VAVRTDQLAVKHLNRSSPLTFYTSSPYARPPPILVNQHDTLRVHAYNGLGEVWTSLHSDGNLFNGTNYDDGAVGTTQCAIPPGETLTYEIPVDLQAGTFWIHVSRPPFHRSGWNFILIAFPLPPVSLLFLFRSRFPIPHRQNCRATTTANTSTVSAHPSSFSPRNRVRTT